MRAGIVDVTEIPVGEPVRETPAKFYVITDVARELFDQNNVFIEEHWREIYERVSKPDEIKKAEAAPRPDTD